MIINGLDTVAPTAALLLFAVLYFGLMMEARLVDPISAFITEPPKAPRSASSSAPPCLPCSWPSTVTGPPVT
jgi:hypothetical protein